MRYIDDVTGRIPYGVEGVYYWYTQAMGAIQASHVQQ